MLNIIQGMLGVSWLLRRSTLSRYIDWNIMCGCKRFYRASKVYVDGTSFERRLELCDILNNNVKCLQQSLLH